MAVVTAVEQKTSNLDDVLKNFNLFGRYHSQLLLMTFLAYLSNVVHSNNFIFAAEHVDYKCKDEKFGNNTCSQIHTKRQFQTCPEWVYDNPDSFVAEFQLACQEWKRTLVGTVHSIGYMVGLLFVGPLSDRLGRKKIIVMTGILGGVIGVAKSFSSWYWLYVALEFLEGAVGDNYSPVFILALEIVASDKRLIYQMLSVLGWSVGGMTLALMGYLFPCWRTFLKVIYAPALLFFFYIFLIDESPRWLLSKGKKKKAIAILEKAADKNKIELDEAVLDKLSCEESRGTNFVELIRSTFASRALLKRFLVCLVWWTISTFVNYGMMINSVSLQGNKYINFAMIYLIQIPGNVVITYIVVRFKRRTPLAVSFIASAMLCLIQPFVPTNPPWLSVTLYMAGKLMSRAYFNITYIYTSELFPTCTRNSMHGLCSSLGRIGSIIAPQTPLLMYIWPGLPSLVFGGASLLAGLVTFLVPDTSDVALPDTVRQAEAVGTKAPGSKEQGDKETVFVIPVREFSRL